MHGLIIKLEFIEALKKSHTHIMGMPLADLIDVMQ
jgi:predicted house-cleaning NTP pyrophosphatase (Maf/HAM1 superfamily)